MTTSSATDNTPPSTSDTFVSDSTKSKFEASPSAVSASLFALCFNLVADAPYSVKRGKEIETALEFLRKLHDQAMTEVEAENAAMVAAEDRMFEEVEAELDAQDAEDATKSEETTSNE